MPPYHPPRYAPPLLYYVSGHGFGHARRSSLVITAILARSPDAVITVRTSASPRLFSPLPAAHVERSEIDAGMAEHGPLTIDARGTLERLVNLIDRADRLVAEEVEAVRRLKPDLILADVPFLAGDVAAATGVPCIAVSNFTWDWICDPLLGAEPAYAVVRERMRAGYGRMSAICQLPFGGVCDTFPRAVPTSLIAARSNRDPADIHHAIGISTTDMRPRVLVGLRGGLPEPILRAAAADAPDYLFLLPAGSTISDPPPNLRPISPAAGASFTDLVAVSDVVVSKLGYGIVSDCIAAGKRLFWPRRSGFREDDVAEREAPAVLRMRELPPSDFTAGAWREALDAIVVQPPPVVTSCIDGAAHVVRTIQTLRETFAGNKVA